MKYAIISDIHSNLEALQKALEIIDTKKVDEIICLGDIVGYGANPNECVELVRGRCAEVILGNHDAASVDTVLAYDFNVIAKRAVLWTSQQLTDENKKYLALLPYVTRRDNILFVHSSPKSPEAWDYIIDADDALVALGSFEEKICFIGHTHVPGIFNKNGKAKSITMEERCIVNVGSIGQPRDGNPMLSFGIFDSKEWVYQSIRSPYDIQTASEKILQCGLPQELSIRILYGS